MSSVREETMLGVERKPRMYGDKMRMAQIVVCSNPACDNELPLFWKSSPFPPTAIAKFASNKGWEIDRHGKHLCPSCAAIPLQPKKESPMPEPVAPKAPTLAEQISAHVNGGGSHVPEFRTPSPVDRRKIVEFLGDHYDTGRSRYIDTWTDHRAAEFLHVPRAWVETIREDFYGPIGANVEMERVLAELGQLRADAEHSVNQALALGTKFEKVMEQVDAMRKRIDGLVEAVGPAASRPR
jgi:hypothetical protein